MRNFVSLVILLAVMAFFIHHDHLDIGWKWEPAPTSRALAPADPDQVDISPEQMKPWEDDGFRFTALATYSITARILHVASYAHDSWSAVCPVDYALGWGRMSDPNVYGQLDISQFERTYIWRYYTSPPPIPEHEISLHSANTHLIPANDTIRDQLFSYQKGDVVHLTGYLVHIDLPDGSVINSSLTRDDVGMGACEVMWVAQAEKVGR